MKAIITDLDRTLLHTDKSVSEHTIAVLKKCHDHGILIMAASARPLRDILIYNNLIGFDAITATNGAVISLHQKLLEIGISCESGEKILSAILQYPDVFLSIETSKGLYSNRDIPVWEPVIWDKFPTLPEDIILYKILASSQQKPLYEGIETTLTDDVYYNADAFRNLEIDIVYISGGNTFATIDRIRKCEFDREIIRYVRNGVIYIGGSAGAHIASRNIEHVAEFDPIPEGMTDFNGLGLFDGILICHYTAERKALYDKLIAEEKFQIFTLSNDDSLVIDSDKDAVVEHYDLLIDENNDPVHDPKPLQEYMNKWDGPAFIEQMQLNNNKSVLEIGVGTGRLAVRVAPLCGAFYGVDISSKTIERAVENLAGFENVSLTCADFLTYGFDRTFDLVYSSLTFMHIEDKQRAVNRIAELMNPAGRFVLSIDKNPSEFIDTGIRKVKIYPDTAEIITGCIKNAGLSLLKQFDTEFATIFVAQKDR